MDDVEREARRRHNAQSKSKVLTESGVLEVSVKKVAL
jgi:hypothetical protein